MSRLFDGRHTLDGVIGDNSVDGRVGAVWWCVSWYVLGFSVF